MNTATSRIAKDIAEVNGKRDHDNPPTYCTPKGDDLTHVDSLVVGPPGTPYEFGFYEFIMDFPATYPDKSPAVSIVSTDGGKIRFNPNLYADGKVCLSILGTWRGESEDEWRSSYSIDYILSVIQSLIMTAKPYHNEPGFEEGSSRDKTTEITDYSNKITHENLRYAVCQLVANSLDPEHKDPPAFKEVIKYQFLMWYYIYLEKATSLLSLDPQKFANMPFEIGNNATVGKFQFASIIETLADLKSSLEKETLQMIENGKESTKKASSWQYYKLLEESDKLKLGELEIPGVSCGLVDDDNLFHWSASIFGPENTDWEGGIFVFEIVFSDNADVPPRIKFQTKMYHPHITEDGIPFYFQEAGRNGRAIPVLKAIKELLEKPINASPVTWLNPVAAKLKFSKDETEIREYRQTVRRCARRSVD